MRERALAMDARYNDQARRLSADAQQRIPLRLAQDEIATRAQEAVTFARDNTVEREAVADMRQIMTDALRRISDELCFMALGEIMSILLL